MSKKLIFSLFCIIVTSLLVWQGSLYYSKVQLAWGNQASWAYPALTFSQEGTKQLLSSEKADIFSVQIPSCSLYKITLDQDGSTKLYCSLYPSRYFLTLYWLAGAPSLLPDFTITIPKNSVSVTHNDQDLPYVEIPNLASFPRQIRFEIEGETDSNGFLLFRKIAHYSNSREGKVDTRKGSLISVKIKDAVAQSKAEYMRNVFPPQLINDIRQDDEQKVVTTLLDNFGADANASDKSPHFTEALLYGLYLLSEEDASLANNVLGKLEKIVVPFRSPQLREAEISGSQVVVDSISAPHTKFPLCPNRDVQAKNWDSMSVKLFLAYQRYQPKVTIKLDQDYAKGEIYDGNGNLLLYNDMVQLDSLCQEIIEKKQEAQLQKLNTIYGHFVNQYFVYSENTGLGTPVIEGSDLLRGVVLRGLAKDPNIAKQRITLEQVKHSLFDGILWEYVYGK